MTKPRVKVVVWDSIGNTLLGVRPWASWEDAHRDQLLREDPDGEVRAASFAQLFDDYDVDLIWFNSVDSPYAVFTGLAEDYAPNLRVGATAEAVAAELHDADFLVLHKERLPADALRHASRLRLVQHLGLDHRGVPMDAARELGVPVAATPLVNYITVAEHVWAFILSWAKRLPALREHMGARAYAGEAWHLFPDLKYLGDLTLGILGMGEIARPIARAARAFDMPTIYWDIERRPELEAAYGMEYVEWDMIFRRADVLTVQLALNEATEGIVGAREIGLMRPTALFINTARGKLVDQPALVAAVAEGRLGAIALDVFAEEPLPPDDPLLDLHDREGGRVTLTPHCAWQSPWTWVRDSQEIWLNVLRSLNGEPIRHRVDDASRRGHRT
jgi:phosphoglycerate dehydrogenase-like enzyme